MSRQYCSLNHSWRWVSVGLDDNFALTNWLLKSMPMMTSSNGNIFPVTDPSSGESTDYRRIPLTKASDAHLWYFLWFAPERLRKQSRHRWSETPLYSLWRHCDVTYSFDGCLCQYANKGSWAWGLYLHGSYILSWGSPTRARPTWMKDIAVTS